jgi:hypothetical protein
LQSNLKEKLITKLDFLVKTKQMRAENYENDLDLLETTNLNTAINYIENKLSIDLQMFNDGTLKVETKVVETKWLDSNELKKFDKQSLSSILNMRSFEVVEDEKAADFLSGIKDDEDLVTNEKDTPILPL